MLHLLIILTYTDRPASQEINVTVDDQSRVVNISWTALINYGDLEHYAISVDNGPPTLTKNTSILYNLSSIESSNSEHFVSLRAVDKCEQEHTANTTISSPENELVPTVNYNEVKKGI